MEHKTKTGNKIHTKIFTMLLVCSLLLAGISTVAMAEASENLIGTLKSFDPTFETGTGELDMSKAVLDENGGHGGNGTHDSNGKSLKLPAAGNSILILASVEPATNYTFSFRMKNSVADSLTMTTKANYFFVMNYNGKKVDRMIGNTKLDPYFDWNHSNFAYLGYETTFGSVHTESEDINKWRQVSINFTTPYEGVDEVHLTLACAKDDPHLAVDDLSLVATGKAPNRIFNGDMEAIRSDKGTPTASNFGLDNVELVQEESSNYLKMNKNTVIQSYNGFFFKGKTLGTRYKISVNYKPDDLSAANNKILFRLRNTKDNDTDKMSYPLMASEGWNTYTMYVDATQAEKVGVPFNRREVWIHNGDVGYVDDMYSGFDESNIGFYKELEFAYDTADTTSRYVDLIDAKYAGDAAALEDVLMFERSIETPTISALPANEDGSRTVKVRAHYLPEPKWGTVEKTDEETGEVTNETTVNFDETNLTLLSAVYKYEKDENGDAIRTLYSLDVEKGTAKKDGKTIDVVDEVIVPKVTGEEWYEIEAMAWDKNGMDPVTKKTILQYK